MMNKHELTQEHLNTIFEYKDGELHWKIANNRKVKVGTIAGYVDAGGYKNTKVCGKQLKNHRLIFLIHYGYLPKMIDHIDGNTLNNRIENLREATPKQNQQNSKLRKNNSSGYRNVYWSKAAQKWQVYCRINGSMKHFGLFNDLELADLVAQEVRNKYFGKYAKEI
jgi:HNH endonuclease